MDDGYICKILGCNITQRGQGGKRPQTFVHRAEGTLASCFRPGIHYDQVRYGIQKTVTSEVRDMYDESSIDMLRRNEMICVLYQKDGSAITSCYPSHPSSSIKKHFKYFSGGGRI